MGINIPHPHIPLTQKPLGVTCVSFVQSTSQWSKLAPATFAKKRTEKEDYITYWTCDITNWTCYKSDYIYDIISWICSIFDCTLYQTGWLTYWLGIQWKWLDIIDRKFYLTDWIGDISDRMFDKKWLNMWHNWLVIWHKWLDMWHNWQDIWKNWLEMGHTLMDIWKNWTNIWKKTDWIRDITDWTLYRPDWICDITHWTFDRTDLLCDLMDWTFEKSELQCDLIYWIFYKSDWICDFTDWIFVQVLAIIQNILTAFGLYNY